MAASDEAKMALQDQWEALLLRIPGELRQRVGEGSGKARIGWIADQTQFPYGVVYFAKRTRDACAHRKKPSASDVERASAIVRALTVLLDELSGTATAGDTRAAPSPASPTYLALPVRERTLAAGPALRLDVCWSCNNCKINSGDGCRECGWGPSRPLHRVMFTIPPGFTYGRQLRLPASAFRGERLPGDDYYVEIVRP